jgi:opacity protein-like surface antigen
MIFAFAGTAIAQDAVFSGSLEFTVGADFGMMLNSPDADLNSFAWGFYTSFTPKATIGFKFFAYTGDEQGYGAVEAGFDFKVHELGVESGFARFYDLLGIGNNVELNYSYDFKYLEGNLELLGIMKMDMMDILFGIKDYLNNGVEEIAGELYPDAIDTSTHPKTVFRAGIQNLQIAEMLTIKSNLKLEYINTTGERGINNFFDTDPFDSKYRWKFIFDLGLGVSLDSIGNIALDNEFSYSEVAVVVNKLGLDILIDQIMEGLEVRLALEADLRLALGTEVSFGDDDSEVIDESPMEFTKFPIQLMVSYKLNMGIIITPKLYIYTDFSAMLSEEEFLPLYIKLNVDLGLGGNGLFVVPIYVAVTSIPLYEDFKYNFDDVKDTDNPPVADELFRLLFGFGVYVKF